MKRPWLAKAQSVGGQIMAKRQREQALNRYYDNPNRCLYCGVVITVREGEKVKAVRIRKYCSARCSGKHNGLPNLRPHPKRKWFCVKCATEIGRRRKYCEECIPKRKVELRAERFGISSCINFRQTTKKELFSSRKNWQSARSNIQRDSRRTFFNSLQQLKCAVCGYDIYIEVCHKKPVSSFSNDATVAEINDISNLVALCRNHHWEFDKGLLKYDIGTATFIRGSVVHKNKRTRTVKPTKEELSILLLNTPMTKIGKRYGVSDNAVRKWCRNYGLVLEKRMGYWAKVQFGKLPDPTKTNMSNTAG